MRGGAGKLLTFSPIRSEAPRLGIPVGGRVIDAAAAFSALHEAGPPDWLRSLKGFPQGGGEAMGLVRRLLAKVERALGGEERPLRAYDPEKAVCLAVNYRAHGAGQALKPPEELYLFPKLANALVGHGWPILTPRASRMVDYEVELAVMIGRRAGTYRRPGLTSTSPATRCSTTSATGIRQYQPGWPDKPDPHGQNWIIGESLDTGAPVGPFPATRDEIPSPYPLGLVLRLNGGVGREGSASDTTFKIPEIIKYVLNGITLKPGDTIATGTPPGIGYVTGRLLRPRDVVECEVERAGVLTNPVVEGGERMRFAASELLAEALKALGERMVHGVVGTSALDFVDVAGAGPAS